MLKAVGFAGVSAIRFFSVEEEEEEKEMKGGEMKRGGVVEAVTRRRRDGQEDEESRRLELHGAAGVGGSRGRKEGRSASFSRWDL